MTTLEDLRKANLKEQRGAPAPTVPTAPTAQAPAPVAAKSEPVKERAINANITETPLIADLTEHGLAMDPKQERIATPPSPSPAPAVIRETIVEAIAIVPAAPEIDPLVERIRAAVLKKRLIPAGVKATVDMSPELFWRAKKYCHDHSNSTLRQLMLEVLTQFLDEEGY